MIFSADRQNYVLISIPNDCLTESASIEWISTLRYGGKHQYIYLLRCAHQQIKPPPPLAPLHTHTHKRLREAEEGSVIHVESLLAKMWNLST